jgi:hypothetical protein
VPLRSEGGRFAAALVPDGAAPFVGEQLLDGERDAGSDLAFQEAQAQVEAGRDAAGGDQVAVIDDPRGYGEDPGRVEQVHPQVPGECGTSFFYFTAKDTSRHYTTVYTGFTIRDDWAGAITVDWNINVVDNFGVTDKTWSTTLASRHFWAGTLPFTVGGPTYIRGEVHWGFAVLWDGTICYSYGPWDQANL